VKYPGHLRETLGIDTTQEKVMPRGNQVQGARGRWIHSQGE